MLNPFLQRTLYSSPVQPILVEIDVKRLSETLGQITGLRLPVIDTIPNFGFAAMAPLTPENILAINNLPGVRMVHANLQQKAFQQPTGPSDWWPTTQSREALEAEQAFREGYTGESIKVGVADTGADVSHPQLQGAEFYSTISWPFREILDENGHGSHVASTVGGRLYNSPVGIQVEGISRARLVCVKCLGRGIGTGFTSEIINAISTCYDKGAQIISMSLGSEDGEPQGGPEADPQWRVIRALTGRGIIFVIAAGNSGPNPNTVGNPGSCPDAITVAALDKTGKVASFSSRGGPKFPTKPDVAAPGVLIYSGTSNISPMASQQANAGYGYVAISGTSMATPHVSGLIALLKHKYPGMTTQRFKEVMASKGKSFDNITGFGLPKWSYFNQ